jgi:hypothetical protein
VWGMALVVIRLAGRGYLVRGAVTIGPLVHTDRYLVGPAMVSAYEIESKHAKFPRVIIDPAVIEVARTHPRDGHTPDEEERYVRSYVQEDKDGRLYFDYISWDSVVHIAGGEDERYGAYMQVLSELLGRGLSNPDSRVLEKYLWVHERYVAVIDMVDEMPSEHPYRAQSPENCGTISGLPRYTADAERAREMVREGTR